jgi:large subunit ribosomal protein L30
MARATKAAPEAAALQVTQVRSGIGTKPKHRATLRALGLRRIGATNTLPDRPEIRGMIARVPHLVRVESVPAAAPARSRSASADAAAATSEEAKS